VQSAGEGFRLPAQAIKEEFKRAPVLHLMLRYTQALITQMSQTAVCNRHHSLDQQLCRWLLLSLDRLRGNELVMTQELIANMLGVRREGVTEGAVKLQKAGLIKYARGRITVLDRPGLERRSCECYAVVKKEYDRCCPLAWRLDRSCELRQAPAHWPAFRSTDASSLGGSLPLFVRASPLAPKDAPQTARRPRRWGLQINAAPTRSDRNVRR
jgi:hypothetical protein